MQLPPVQDIIRDDHWLRSKSDGRYLLLRGVCFGPSAKLPPNLPFKSKEDWTALQTYVDLLKACGFTTLRLPFFWSAFEPICDPDAPKYNEDYLNDFFEYVRLFGSKGFLIIIDVHQDLLGTAFGGSGMPEWVFSEGVRSRAFLRDTPLWGANYAFNTNLRKTFTDFWNNDLTNRSAGLEHFKVRDRFLEMIDRLAEKAAATDRVLGIEILNEPHPATIDPRKFEEEILPEFYTGAVARIRTHSQDLFALLSPQSDWNVNLRSEKDYDSLLPVASTDERVIFAYHYYDSQLTALAGRIFHDAKRDEYIEAQLIGAERAREKNMVPFLTEFGTRQNWRSAVVRKHMDWQFEAVEQALVNATYWNINLYNTRERLDGFMREDFSLIGYNKKIRNLDIATRPYVVAGSAEPVHMHFNSRTKEFKLVMRGKPVDAPTVLYLPRVQEHPLQPVHYEDGFTITYGRDARTELADNTLSLWLDTGAELHEITIQPRI